MITITEEILEGLLERAAERGAQKALASVGLADDRASNDVRGLRDLFAMYHIVRNGALKQLGAGIALIVLAAISVYVGVKLKIGQ